MVSKLLISSSLLLLFSHCLFAQDSQARFLIGVESQYLIGGETNSSYDFLMGGRATYFFKKKGNFEFYSSLGFATDIVNTDSRLLSFDATFGSSWAFSKRFSLFAGTGGHYMHESHSLLLIEGKETWQNNIFGITGHFGISWQFSRPLNVVLFLKRTNLNYASVGLGINYSF